MHILKEWLCKHPLTNTEDVAFLQAEERKFQNVLLAANLERSTISKRGNSPTPGSGIIFTETAQLRLVHCLIQNDVRQHYLDRHKGIQRPELDARNSPHRPKSWEERVCEKFNDSSFKPMSLVYPLLHADFAHPQELFLEHCPTTLTPEHVSSWIQDRKNKLMKLMYRWGQSGNGDGMPAPTVTPVFVDELGVYKDTITYTGARKADFLHADKPSLLYFWKVLEEFQMVDSTVTTMPDEIGVSSSAATPQSSIASTPASARKRHKTADDFLELQRVNSTTQKEVCGIIRAMVGGKSDNMDALDNRRKAVASAEKAYLSIMEKAETRGISPKLKKLYEERAAKALKRLEDAEFAFEAEQERAMANGPPAPAEEKQDE